MDEAPEPTWQRYRCPEPDCGTVIYVSAAAASTPRRPCPDCGSMAVLERADQRPQRQRIE